MLRSPRPLALSLLVATVAIGLGAHASPADTVRHLAARRIGGHGPATHERQPQPGELNVILVVLDDMGTDKLAMYGADVGPPVHCASAQAPWIPTPTLDQLRAEGVMFTRCYSSPTCSPTRGTIMTGRYAMRTGMGYAIYPTDNPGYTLPSSEVLLPELLRDANPFPYRRGAFGKWHLTDYDSNDCNPADNGFEVFQGIQGNANDHYDWRKVTSFGGSPAGCTSTLSEDVRDPAGSPPSIAAWNADVTRLDAAAWIHGLGPSERFFAYVCFNPPHAPFQVPPFSTLSQDTRTQLGALSYEAGDVAHGGNHDEERMIFHANIEAVDHELGQLLSSIPADVMARTMVVVMGDNGTVGPMISDPTLAGHGKRSLYELGTHVPLLVKGPLVGAHAGETCRSLVGAVDVWRTVAEITGIRSADVDATLGGATIDSQSFLAAILEPARPLARTTCYSEEFVNGGVPPAVPEWKRGITDGSFRYKRIDYPPDVRRENLYHTAADPCELIDLLAPGHQLTPDEAAALASLRAAMDAI